MNHQSHSNPDQQKPAHRDTSIIGLRDRICNHGIWNLFAILGAGICLLTACALFGRLHWTLELTSHFRFQYFLALLPISILMIALRRWQIAIFLGFFALINAAVVVPVYFNGTQKAASEESVKILFANIYVLNRDLTSLKHLINQARPDVIVLAEINQQSISQLADLEQEYPLVIHERNSGAFGISMYCRQGLSQPKIQWVGKPAVPIAISTFQLADQDFTLIGAHVFTPTGAENLAMRSSQLEALGAVVSDQPTAVIGDLNISPWSPYFSDLLSATKMRDSRSGFGNQASWPTDKWLLRIPIDHCLVSQQVVVKDRRVCDFIGSDHLPILLELGIEETGR